MKRKLVVLLVVLFVGTMSIASAYVWPTVSTTITSWYGPRNTGIPGASTYHYAVDIGAVKANVDGDPCFAVGDGKIIYTTTNGGGAGKYIELQLDNPNGDKIVAKYLHLSQILVSTGDKVKMGQVIGKMGKTGIGSGTHLDFRVQKNGSWVNLNSYVKEYLKNPKSSGSTGVYECPTCGSLLDSKYYSTGTGKHYRACKGKTVHHVIEGHFFNNDDKCECGVFKCGVDKCDGIVETKYLVDKINNVHYKVCSKNPLKHHHQVAGHIFMTGKCVCGESKNSFNANSSTLGHNNPLVGTMNTLQWASSEMGVASRIGVGNAWKDNQSITAKEFLNALHKVLKSKNVAKASGKVYLQEQLGKENTAYVELAQMLGKKSGEKENLGKKELKLILGNSDATVKSNYNKPITREQAANIMGLFVEDGSLTTINTLKASDWDKVNETYKKRINELAQKDRQIFRGELVNGKIYINPTSKLTGVEAKALLARLYNSL